MNKTAIKSPGGLWYALYTPTVQDPLNRTLVVTIQGNGSHATYGSGDMSKTVFEVVERNGFAQDIAYGQELPFMVLAPLAEPGGSITNHDRIASEIGSIAAGIDAECRLIGGLSLGSQTTAGFLFSSRNGTELSKNLPSGFKNSSVFDGFFMFCGQIPSTPDPCANPKAGIFIIHATGDTAVRIKGSFNIKDKANSCPERLEKVYSTHLEKYVGSQVTYVKSGIPADAVNKFIVIEGGGHSTSWNEGYNWLGKEGTPGYEFRVWIEEMSRRKRKPVEPEEPLEIPGTVFKQGSQVFAKFTDGTTIELAVK